LENSLQTQKLQFQKTSEEHKRIMDGLRQIYNEYMKGENSPIATSNNSDILENLRQHLKASNEQILSLKFEVLEYKDALEVLNAYLNDAHMFYHNRFKSII
jgi:hypothetical protein